MDQKLARLAQTLTVKDGTSLSRDYQVIDRFSKDIDLTHNSRALVAVKYETTVPATQEVDT